jgi:hypothetical protein
MWRELKGHEEIVELAAGVSLSIPVGTRFQFRCDGAETLVAVGTTMPPWPSANEAYFAEGPWAPTGCRDVYVILDPNFGERLRGVWPGRPVWIVMTPNNEPVIRSLWSESSEPNHLMGITGMPLFQERGAEGCFLAYLDEIDLHHGHMSSDTPYTLLKVIGTTLTGDIKSALLEYGFTQFSEDSEGFEARRTEEEAARLRE